MSERLVPLGRKPMNVASGASQAGAPAATASRWGDAARVYIETYGCQMNVADSDMVVGLLAEAGMTTTNSADDADVILINTCAVRDKAEERVYARARELGAQKKRRKNVVLAVTGCMAEHLKERILQRAPAVDIIAGPDSYRRLPAMVAAARGNPSASVPGATAVVDVRLDKAETYDGLSGAVGGDGISGFVTIQRGCDKFCTFCVVPFTRGRERGTPPREVLRQTRAYANAGYKEVVLLGQTVNSYYYPRHEPRHELASESLDGDGPEDSDVNFADLLRAVATVEGIERIRFTSPYPVDFTSAVIDAIADEPKICNQLHLPVQSGSDAVLERMRRGYTVDQFRAIVSELRNKIPDIALSTDILSGFSGETEADHEATLALMREIRFDSAFMFVYSERDITYAAKKQPDDVPAAEKKRRIREIVALQETIATKKNAELVGKRVRVLIHAVSKRSDQHMVGRSDGFKAVIVPASAGNIGDIIDVEIQRSTMATLFGRRVS